MFRSYEHPRKSATVSTPARVAVGSLIVMLRSLTARVTSPATGFGGSRWLYGPHRAENFPAAVRELLEHREHGASGVLRLATRRVDVRRRVSTPLDRPATIQKSEVLGFRDVAQHLEILVGGLAFVARSDGLLADVRRRADAETNGVIGPKIRQRNRISRHGRVNVLLAQLRDRGEVRSAVWLAARCHELCVKHLSTQDGQRADNNSNRMQSHAASNSHPHTNR